MTSSWVDGSKLEAVEKRFAAWRQRLRQTKLASKSLVAPSKRVDALSNNLVILVNLVTMMVSENDKAREAAGIEQRFVALELAVKDLAAAIQKNGQIRLSAMWRGVGAKEKASLISASRPIRLASYHQRPFG